MRPRINAPQVSAISESKPESIAKKNIDGLLIKKHANAYTLPEKKFICLTQQSSNKKSALFIIDRETAKILNTIEGKNDTSILLYTVVNHRFVIYADELERVFLQDLLLESDSVKTIKLTPNSIKMLMRDLFFLLDEKKIIIFSFHKTCELSVWDTERCAWDYDIVLPFAPNFNIKIVALDSAHLLLVRQTDVSGKDWEFYTINILEKTYTKIMDCPNVHYIFNLSVLGDGSYYWLEHRTDESSVICRKFPDDDNVYWFTYPIEKTSLRFINAIRFLPDGSYFVSDEETAIWHSADHQMLKKYTFSVKQSQFSFNLFNFQWDPFEGNVFLYSDYNFGEIELGYKKKYLTELNAHLLQPLANMTLEYLGFFKNKPKQLVDAEPRASASVRVAC